MVQILLLVIESTTFSGKLTDSIVGDGPPPMGAQESNNVLEAQKSHTPLAPIKVATATMGTAPSQILTLNFFSNSSLSIIDLSNNGFKGPVPIPPPAIGFHSESGNEFTGEIPSSICNATGLEGAHYHDLWQIARTWKFLISATTTWRISATTALPELQVLVLRSNRFHGPLNCSKNTDRLFAKLHILDLSNIFSGPLPVTIIVMPNAMKDEEKGGLQYMENRRYDYQDSVKESFEGLTPEAIGYLKALKGLNFSHNTLTGRIPSSVGNLTNLEWVDLFSNKLTGQIPTALAEFGSLSYLNLSGGN
ncbi:hypothetical protein CDL15_Pgr027055 [Punica granatum]|uniref:Uncharacterized protein n=1 Tax=Punica granatum TaxID=22663 RepID=A0A218XHT2_PUNGR|nr:hypothetical protein CDL15_Pgr027055 [Punica granatum]